jgi:hypothetical protein
MCVVAMTLYKVYQVLHSALLHAELHMIKHVISQNTCSDRLVLPVSFPHVISAGNSNIQGGSNMTGTNCDLFTHK